MTSAKNRNAVDFIFAFIVCVSFAMNVVVALTIRQMSRTPIDALSRFCGAAKLTNYLLYVGDDGEAHELCPCQGCREFLATFIEHAEQLEQEHGSVVGAISHFRSLSGRWPSQQRPAPTRNDGAPPS